MEWKHVIVIVFLLAAVSSSDAADAMRLLAAGFIKVFEDCQKELNIEEGLVTDLYRFWKQEFSEIRRSTGCAIICMSKKLDLLTGDGKIHHGNAKEYAMKHGADEDLATKMIDIMRSCDEKGKGIEDECWRALEVAKCFRVGIHQLKWEPSADVIITEILTDI